MDWLILLSLVRLFFYFGVFSFMGYVAMLGLFNKHATQINPFTSENGLMGWLWCSFFISLVGMTAVVPLNAGMLLDEGLSGVIDPLMLQLVWNSAIGEQTLARGIALSLVLVILIWINQRKRQGGSSALVFSVLFTSAVIGWSFTRSGHSATTSLAAQLCIALHVMMAGWWIGSLYPLIRLSRTEHAKALQLALQAYGKQAVVWVGILLMSGGILITLLLLNVSSTVNNVYLWVMAAKLTLVCGMLCFAAYHKWKLVGRIETRQDCIAVRKSITAEALIGVLVLMVTATLSNSIGIAD